MLSAQGVVTHGVSAGAQKTKTKIKSNIRICFIMPVHIILSLPSGAQNGHNQPGDERFITRGE